MTATRDVSSQKQRCIHSDLDFARTSLAFLSLIFQRTTAFERLNPFLGKKMQRKKPLVQHAHFEWQETNGFLLLTESQLATTAIWGFMYRNSGSLFASFI